jgi:hypothetical protein
LIYEKNFSTNEVIITGAIIISEFSKTMNNKIIKISSGEISGLLHKDGTVSTWSENTGLRKLDIDDVKNIYFPGKYPLLLTNNNYVYKYADDSFRSIADDVIQIDGLILTKDGTLLDHDGQPYITNNNILKIINDQYYGNHHILGVDNKVYMLEGINLDKRELKEIPELSSII